MPARRVYKSQPPSSRVGGASGGGAIMNLRRTIFALLSLVTVAACAPQVEPGRSSGAQPDPAAPSKANKTLTVVIQAEPVAFIRNLHVGIQGDVGREAQYVMHDTLDAEMEFEVYIPQLAQELPSIEKGTWRVNPDGSMDTIWKLRPTVKWHAGHQF